MNFLRRIYDDGSNRLHLGNPEYTARKVTNDAVYASK